MPSLDDDNEYDDDDFEKDEGAKWEEYKIDDVELFEQIGGGGVGIVYSGMLFGKTPVAVKTLFDPRVDEALKQEYMDELLVMSKLNHKNIVNFYGACMKPPKLFFVMELCERSLYDLLHKELHMEVTKRDIIEMACGTAAAMNHLHIQEPTIIHRDLKSLNLLIAGDGSIKLCDFGLVSTRVTAAGTPAYMAPELLQSKPFSKKVDVYAFGILLWELYNREIPFAGYSAYDIREKICAGERMKIPTIDCPYECQDLIRTCWASDPNERPNFDEILPILCDVWERTPHKSNLEMLDDFGGDTLDSLLK